MYHRNNGSHGKTAIVRIAMRKGLTLPELIISIAIMVMIAGAMAVLSNGVQSVAEHTQGLDLASQHGRIAMSRIDNNLRKAFANESFPGVFVLSTSSGSYTFPDTLFIWRPDVAAANPAGLPMVRELVVYTPDATSPNNLLEITWPSSSATCPATSDVTSWSTLANNFRTGNGPVRTVLTNMLRSNPVSANSSTTKGAIRFRVMMQPDATEWAAYRAGTLAWSNLDWPQDLRGSTTGTRIVACQTEMQLLPTTGDINNATGQGILPMFSSSSISYSLNK
ncbi:MAG: PulJ/GspJ family protein [Planctomycetaceae bacterium]